MWIDLGARRVHVGGLEEAPGDPCGSLYFAHPVVSAQLTVAVPMAGLMASVAPNAAFKFIVCLSIRFRVRVFLTLHGDWDFLLPCHRETHATY